MPNINFIDSNGEHHSVDVSNGSNIMEAALDNSIEGILGDCGGVLSCATCHCYLDENGVKLAPAVSDSEEMMLDSVLERSDKSRLGCQVALTNEMEGITITIPESQF